ncbi:hypothetical protein CKO51_25720 [Rhodopirellula sp. SM50]|nr:hypothetical protein CKO51_25720 [Rhodopirellula sp. SM50]
MLYQLSYKGKTPCFAAFPVVPEAMTDESRQGEFEGINEDMNVDPGKQGSRQAAKERISSSDAKAVARQSGQDNRGKTIGARQFQAVIVLACAARDVDFICDGLDRSGRR